MPPITNRTRLTGVIGAVLLIGVLLRIWHFAGGRAVWFDEAMVALNIIHLSPSGLMGPLYFDQLAPAGWLLLEKACLQLWGPFDYTLRLPALVGGIAALFLFYRFLRYAAGAWETLAGVAMMAVLPIFIQYASMVKPYIFDVFFSVALLHAALMVLREQGQRLRKTWLFGAIGILCIPLSFGGTLTMAGTGTLLFIASVTRKETAWALALVAVGVVWGLLFWAVYSFSYAHNAHTITNMTNLYWTANFAPLPVSLRALAWYPAEVGAMVSALMLNPNAMTIVVIWLYGMVRMAREDRWLPALVVSPVVATLIASMLAFYPISSRLILGIAPPLLFGVACGAVGIVKLFSQRRLATVAMLALIGYSPIKHTAKLASEIPPFPMEEIKPNLAYLKRHFQPGDQLILTPPAVPAFVLYAERFGLSDMDYKVTSNFHLDQSCVYSDVRMIRDAPRAWLLFYHMIILDRPGTQFVERALGITGSLAVANAEHGSRLFLYKTSGKKDVLKLPPSAAICSRPRMGEAFIDRITENTGPHLEAD